MIVVADDESDIRRLVAISLRRRGHEVIEAARGDQALSLIRESRPDLAVLDVMMPGMTGLEVAQALSADEALAGTPVVLLSAKGQAAEVQQGLQSGAAAYVTKPFAPGDLARRVEELLSGG